MEALQAYVDKLNLGPWPTAGIIVAASIVIAQLTAIISTRVLARIARRTQTDLDDEAIRILRKPIFMSVLLLGLGLADVQLDLAAPIESTTISILKTFAVLVWMGAIFRLTNLLLSTTSRSASRRQLMDPTTAPLFNNLIKIATVAGGIYLIISAWHIDATAWLASAGIVGIAVGFAAKDTLANLFAGVFILADAPYKVGDYINFETGERGEVTHIGLRSTRILTRDDIEVTVPNAVIGAAKIVNETGGRWPRMRLKVRVGVAYGSDLDTVRGILIQTAKDSKLVVSDPEPQVRFRAFGDSSLDFDLLVWIEEPVWRGRTVDELLMVIYRRFGEEGVQIPFPQRDLYIKSMPASET